MTVSNEKLTCRAILLDDWGSGHWLLQIGLQSPGHGSTLLTWSVGIIASDYCHLSSMVKFKHDRFFNLFTPVIGKART